MPAVRDTARLHPETVSNHTVHTKRKPRKKPNRALRGREIKVDPRVWHTAMKLAKGDNGRIVIVSSTEVIVRNPKH